MKKNKKNNYFVYPKSKIYGDKKALSEMIAYVLLVTIAISLSILVYVWLKSQTAYVKPENACPDSVSLTIESYSCSGKIINLTFRNRGLFNIDGFIARIGDSSDIKPTHYFRDTTQKTATAEHFFYADKKQVPLKPNEEYKGRYNYSVIGSIAKIELQPFILDNGVVLCKQITNQDIAECN